MKAIIAGTLAALLLCVSSCVDEQRIDSKTAIEAARMFLRPEQRDVYNRITRVEWQKHVKSWMVVFEHKNPKIEDGIWVLVDQKGKYEDSGKVYADH